MESLSSRSKRWKQTYTGRRFSVFNPTEGDICIEDIAHSLAGIARFTCHTHIPYSVAQHSVYVAQLCSPEMKPYGLMHDAPEAYIGDISPDIKAELPLFRAVEAHLLQVIQQRYGLKSIGVPPEVDAIDKRMCLTEGRDLMPGGIDGWAAEWASHFKGCKAEPFENFGIQECWGHTRAKSEFLAMFGELFFKPIDVWRDAEDGTV